MQISAVVGGSLMTAAKVAIEAGGCWAEMGSFGLQSKIIH
jgi:hypothetical protein